MNLADLAKPFDPHEIEWRIAQAGEKDGKPWARVFAYVTNRAIQARLDAVCGPANWANELKDYRGLGALCGIGIRMDDVVRNQSLQFLGWVWKWDGANDTDYEPIKGGLSDSMKRAAVQWGIGRYLYNLEASFLPAECISTERRYGGDENGWRRHYDRGKGLEFWWKPPELPAWALPEKPQSAPSGVEAPDPEFRTRVEKAVAAYDGCATADKFRKLETHEGKEKFGERLRKLGDATWLKRFTYAREWARFRHAEIATNNPDGKAFRDMVWNRAGAEQNGDEHAWVAASRVVEEYAERHSWPGPPTPVEALENAGYCTQAMKGAGT